MGVLSFKKVERAVSKEEYANSYPSDSGVPGTYSGNMSEEDSLRWKAKVVGQRQGNHAIEIRTTEAGANLVISVSGKMPKPIPQKWGPDLVKVPHEVKLSANGPAFFSPHVWGTLILAVAEAKGVLCLLDGPEGDRKTALQAIRAGVHPLGD